jgi:hypothetical protein
MKERGRLAKIDDGAISLLCPNGSTYDIELTDIQSAEHVLPWIEQLSSKSWVTKEHLRMFNLLCLHHLGLKAAIRR